MLQKNNVIMILLFVGLLFFSITMGMLMLQEESVSVPSPSPGPTNNLSSQKDQTSQTSQTGQTSQTTNPIYSPTPTATNRQ